MRLIDQYKTLDPSVAGATYRRLQRDDDVNYLREQDGIIGFEVNLKQDRLLSGFTLIGIKKHTILAYRREDGYQLVLFPGLSKLFDESFGLMDLEVAKRFYPNDSFKGKLLGRGPLREMIRDLTPPMKQVDLPEFFQFKDRINSDADIDTTSQTQAVSDEPAHDLFGETPDFDETPDFGETPDFMDAPSFDDTPDFMEDSFAGADEFEDISVAEQLELMHFESPHAVIDTAVGFGADRARLINILNALLNKHHDKGERILAAALQDIVIRLFKEGRER